MNCAYHSHNAATVSCNGCGRPLCPACDHRIKGFPYCQDCIVKGIDLLRDQYRGSGQTTAKGRTSPVVATLLSMICPGLGAAYNGQMVKAIVYFAVFVGLFQMAVLTAGTPLFVLGFMGMWAFGAVDSWRTAKMIRSGMTPDAADDLLVQRFSGNPKLWGVVLGVLGIAFLFQKLFNLGVVIRAVLPIMLIALGIYVLRGYIVKPKAAANAWTPPAPTFALHQQQTRQREYESSTDFADRRRSGSWRDV